MGPSSLGPSSSSQLVDESGVESCSSAKLNLGKIETGVASPAFCSLAIASGFTFRSRAKSKSRCDRQGTEGGRRHSSLNLAKIQLRRGAGFYARFVDQLGRGRRAQRRRAHAARVRRTIHHAQQQTAVVGGDGRSLWHLADRDSWSNRKLEPRGDD